MIRLYKLFTGRGLVLVAAAACFGLWLTANFGMLAADQNGVIRFVLSLLFAVLILLRPKATRDETFRLPVRFTVAGAFLGAAMTVGGLIFNVHQVEWLGILLLLFATLEWALPPRYRRDILFALFLLYWLHPLPAQVFGPLQIGMQRLSVIGSEHILHALNARVWGDGLVIRTGMRTFEVPEACSGMKTAVTVLLCTLGSGFLLRLRWHETLWLTAAGLVQVLALNIVRITIMVRVGADMPPEWSDQALHSSVGVFLLIAVLLVQFEATAWKRYRSLRDRREVLRRKNELDDEDKASRLPHLWRNLLRWWWTVPVMLFAIALVAGFLYKNRPYHRAEMIREVAEEMMVGNLDNAERAINAALALNPSSEPAQMTRLRVLFQRKRYQEVLDALAARAEATLTLEDRVMKSECLLRSGRMEEALAELQKVPDEQRQWPGVAMIFAEYYALRDKPELVVREVLRASRWSRLTERVRGLFPYLAARELWDAIVKCDNDTPYSNPIHALISATANLNMNRVEGAESVMKRAMSRWPRDPIFLDPLLGLASLRPGSDWEAQFETNLVTNVEQLTPDGLARYIEACFVPRRPDLSWVLYRRLATVEPEHPAIYLMPVEHGEEWFVFRRQRLGLSASSTEDTVDLRSFCQLTRQLPPWSQYWRSVPLLEDMLSPDRVAFNAQYLDLCIRELRRREAAGPLRVPTQLLYVRTLRLLNRFEEAQTRLKALEARHPESRREFLLKEAELFEQEERWGEAYEAMRTYFSIDEHPSVVPYLMMGNTLMRQDLGAMALGVLERARQVFPDTDRLYSGLASVWAHYAHHEEALFFLGQVKGVQDLPFLASLLNEAGRANAARKTATAAGIADRPEFQEDNQKQSYSLPPAEYVMKWHGGLLDDAAYLTEARYVENLARFGQGSPFLEALAKLRVQWYRERGAGAASDKSRWLAAGRDEHEQAAALDQLAILLARQGRMEEAAALSQEAAARFPESPALWRVAIALNGGQTGVVARAFQACPLDPDIWLAHLVSGVQAPNGKAWASTEVERVVAQRTMPAGTIVRAGDYLLRLGETDAATTAARDAVQRGQGLLPAYILGMRCAMAGKDTAWALTCALAGVENALEPWPFYRVMVAIKSMDRQNDGDLIRALESLDARFPEQTQWAERLGGAYFSRGQMDHALGVLDAVMQRAGPTLAANSYVLGAESARQQGQEEKAIRLLESAYALHPDNLSVLNNLVYYLALKPKSLPKAMSLLPKLVEMGGDNFAILDTMAVVYYRSGDTRKAEDYMRRALAKASREDYSWAEVHLNAAELQLALGNIEEARRIVDMVQRDTRRSPANDIRANDLRRRIDAALER